MILLNGGYSKLYFLYIKILKCIQNFLMILIVKAMLENIVQVYYNTLTCQGELKQAG